MSEPTSIFTFLDFGLKATGSGIALAGAFVAVMKWLDQRHNDNLTAKVESQKPFSIKQQEIYIELVKTTATIVNSHAEDVRQKAQERFWIMYWGVVPLVADQAVSVAIDDYSELLYKNPTDNTGLLNLSMALSRACRISLGDSWNADLKQLRPARPPLSSE